VDYSRVNEFGQAGSTDETASSSKESNQKLLADEKKNQ
jgi:hypothetical protein